MSDRPLVSPVWRVILMVAITVILAGVIAWFAFGMAGEVINASDEMQIPTPTLTPISIQTIEQTQIPYHYEKIIVTDKSKSSSNSVSPIYTIYSGNKVYPISDSWWAYGWYDEIKLGKTYIMMLQGNKIIRAYTLPEAFEYCDLRPYVNGTKCLPSEA